MKVPVSQSWSLGKVVYQNLEQSHLVLARSSKSGRGVSGCRLPQQNAAPPLLLFSFYNHESFITQIAEYRLHALISSTDMELY